jgi:hypothetical protein
MALLSFFQYLFALIDELPLALHFSNVSISLHNRFPYLSDDCEQGTEFWLVYNRQIVEGGLFDRSSHKDQTTKYHQT